MNHIPRLTTPCIHETMRELMASYTTGSCSNEEKSHFERHCLSCEKCLTTLAAALNLLRSRSCDEKNKALGELYPIGVKAARTAKGASSNYTLGAFRIPLKKGNSRGGDVGESCGRGPSQAVLGDDRSPWGGSGRAAQRGYSRLRRQWALRQLWGK